MHAQNKILTSENASDVRVDEGDVDDHRAHGVDQVEYHHVGDENPRPQVEGSADVHDGKNEDEQR